jgi:hypothetical protein
MQGLWTTTSAHIATDREDCLDAASKNGIRAAAICGIGTSVRADASSLRLIGEEESTVRRSCARARRVDRYGITTMRRVAVL